jgi:mRNA-degrading endonuclease RelE of RelBE toxin-antitoxin system
MEAELEKLPREELRQIREWLDEILEDGLSFTPEFEAAIQESEWEMAAGVRPRMRQP